jgi:ribonuclease VapC
VSRYVLDASAVLALLENEPGADHVAVILSQAVIGAVNLAEVHSKLIERGRHGREALAQILSVSHGVVPFTEEQAILTGSLQTATQHIGLSLGDRACLALGIALRAEVYTAERLWAGLQVNCLIHLIR